MIMQGSNCQSVSLIKPAQSESGGEKSNNFFACLQIYDSENFIIEII